jgi:O-antigen ligase
MSTRALQRAERQPPLQVILLLAGATIAVALGVLAVFNAQLAVTLLLVTGLGVGVLLHPASILGLLIVTVFVEAISFGGFTASRVIAPLAVLVVAAAVARGRASLRPAAPLLWAALYAAWALASGFWTVSWDHTTYLLGSLSIGLVFMVSFATLLDSVTTLRRVLMTLAAGGFLIGLYAIGSFFAGTAERSDPATGDPNFFATYQLIALPVTLVLASEARARWVRFAWYVTAITLVGSVLTTLSRGGFLTLLAVTLILLIIPARTIFRSRTQKVAAFLVLLVAATFVFRAASDTIVPRLETIVAEGQTGAGRTNEWRAAATSINERPALGLGYGAFPSVSNELMRRTPGVDLQTFQLRPEGSAAHNAFISTLAELGVVGLVLFCGLIGSTALLLRRTARQARQAGAVFLMRVANALLVGFCGWFVASMFLNTEVARPLWILVGISLALPKLVARELASGSTRLEVSPPTLAQSPPHAAGGPV